MKQILQREIKYHNKGMEEHSKLFKKTRSKKQKEMWQDPEYRAKMLDSQHKRREREWREKLES